MGTVPDARSRDDVYLSHCVVSSLLGDDLGHVDREDATANAPLDAAVDEEILKLVQVEIALAGARWAPHPPVPKQERLDTIASPVLNLTGWTSVASASAA